MRIKVSCFMALCASLYFHFLQIVSTRFTIILATSVLLAKHAEKSMRNITDMYYTRNINTILCLLIAKTNYLRILQSKLKCKLLMCFK